MNSTMQRYRWRGILSGLLILLLLAAQASGLFRSAELRVQDACYQKGELIRPDLFVIGIDEETMLEYGEWQSFSRTGIAELIEILNQDPELAPAVIGVDVGFYGEKDPKQDEQLAQAAALLNNVVTVSYVTFGQEVVETGQGFRTRDRIMTLEEPYQALKEQTETGFSNIALDEDGIVRHSLYTMEGEGETLYSFACRVYEKYMGEMPRPVLDGKTEGYIPFAGRPYDFYGSETAGLSMSRVLNGEIPTELFAGAIVLVGAYSTGMMDSYYTAVNRSVPMYGVEIHANILQALLDGNEKAEPDMVQTMLITLAVLCLAGAVLFIPDLRICGAGILALMTGWWFGAGWIYENGYILPLLYPIAGCGVLFAGHILMEYVMERAGRKRLVSIFGKYVPRQVVSGIVKRGEEALRLGGQKKDIAVLFVDIRGFTPLSESLPPEQVVEVLNRYLALTTEAVFANDGMVDKFIGDATMAVYNAPLDQEDYVFKAVKTGLDMVKGARLLEKELKKITDRSVDFGIGVNCGEAVVGNIGTGQRMEYTAIGDTVNTAARLESQAKAGEVLISTPVYERLKDRIEVTCLGTRKLKGKAEEAVIYRVEGLKAEGMCSDSDGQ